MNEFMDKEFIATLQKKEQELSKQLDSIRTTITLFQNGNSENGHTAESSETIAKPNIPSNYSDDFTWNEKVLYALGRIKNGFVPDIVKELQKVSKDDETLLLKRITVIASNLKKNGILGGKAHGRKLKYFIK